MASLSNGLASPLDMKAAFLQHLPDALSPTTLQKTVAEKAKTLAAELDLPEVHLAPLSQEELHAVQAQTPQISDPLIKCYPTHLEEASVQTSLRENATNPADDYHVGEPVDGIRSFGVTKRKMAPLKFVLSQPKPTLKLEENRDDEEYTSFLPDFRRAGDPLAIHKETPATSDSNTSSEWEFLDN